MESSVLSYKRLWTQIKADLFIYRKYYIYLLLGGVGLFVLYYLFKAVLFGSVNLYENMQYLYFWTSATLILVIFSASAFKPFRDDYQTLQYLVLPSSSLEKFLSMWLITLLLPFIVYIVLFYLVDLVLGGIVMVIGGHFYLANVFNFHVEIYSKLLIYTSIFFLGAATFKRDAWLKTILVWVVITIAFSVALIIPGLIIKNCCPQRIVFQSPFKLISSMRVFNLISSIVFWFIAYLKVTEKQA
jgi:hypothetical protein